MNDSNQVGFFGWLCSLWSAENAVDSALDLLAYRDSTPSNLPAVFSVLLWHVEEAAGEQTGTVLTRTRLTSASLETRSVDT